MFYREVGWPGSLSHYQAAAVSYCLSSMTTVPGCGLVLGCVYWSLGDRDSGVSDVCLTVTFIHIPLKVNGAKCPH